MGMHYRMRSRPQCWLFCLAVALSLFFSRHGLLAKTQEPRAQYPITPQNVTG